MSDVNPCISEDIWFEIFKKFPVKTLGKCRCVCKSWHSLIISSSFMAAHFKHYTQNETNSLILYKHIAESSKFGSTDFEQISLFRDFDMMKQGNRLHTSIFPFIVPQTFPSCFYFVGSVNGLLCVSDSSHLRPRDRILIWNPLIQKSVKLPESNFTTALSVVGFGYDCLRNDHRVVKISYSDTKKPLVEVYSVQERTWRTISAKYLVDNSIINNVSASQCFHRGVIHWLLLSKNTGIGPSLVECLLLFDVAEERFAKMELPKEIVKNGSRNFGIFEYGGRLSVSHCDYRVRNMEFLAQCNIWVKRDDNVEGSWCKILRVINLHDYCHMCPIEYLGANEVLIGMDKENNGQLVSYDPKTRQITKLGFLVSESTKFSAYSESLALLDQKIDDRRSHC
ncbi:F-box/kelch-repeat protein At3g06240-like [Silene latifolia]|uniref:F-box/kelch-repeat protein At3g06240-like n=1 Tax=Silene latifolia TaxID=37657 RepID=UPI003D76FED6